MSGNGPPSNVSPSALVAALKQKPRPSKVVQFSDFVSAAAGTKFERIRVMVPTSGAHGMAQLAAHNRLRDDIKLPADQWESEVGKSILSDLVAKEQLAQTLYSEYEIAPGRYERLLFDSRDVDAIFSSDEVAVLFDLWLQVQRELGPRLSVLTAKEAEEWVEVLKAGLDPLARLSLPDLVTLVTGFHRLLVEHQKSSACLPQPSPDSTSPDTSESNPESSATDISSSGEPQSPLLESTTELWDSETAAAIAAKMARGEL